MILSPASVFIIFVVFVMIIICAKDAAQTMLYMTIMTNFIIVANVFTTWNYRHEKNKKSNNPEDDAEADLHDYTGEHYISETTPLNPPALDNDVKQPSREGYDTLQDAKTPDYGPRYREYDSLRQPHLNTTPAKQFPKDIFSTNDANSKFSLDSLTRGRRIQRSIDDMITRDHKWYGYLYADEFQYQDTRHWMSNYEY